VASSAPFPVVNAPELATYWQSWKDTGAAPSPSPFDGHYGYTYDPGDAVYSFGVDGGWTVSCSTVRHTVLYTPTSDGGPCRIPSSTSGDRCSRPAPTPR
jgi:hypothetical protein